MMKMLDVIRQLKSLEEYLGEDIPTEARHDDEETAEYRKDVEALSAAISALFPSPRGDKLCLQNCPTGACGIGPGSDRITISHSTATGKWQLEIKIPLIFLREPLQTAMQVAAMETRFAQSADSH